MGLFDFMKKEEKGCECGEQKVTATCSCGSQCGISEIENARFIVLGSCCKKSTETFENTKIAVKEMGFEDEVLNIGDNAKIAEYGVMQTPALIIDNKVVSYGKLLKVEDVKKLIEKNGG
jgi:small redox-active disulfide protein 2